MNSQSYDAFLDANAGAVRTAVAGTHQPLVGASERED
jgi:hypothetical protein